MSILGWSGSAQDARDDTDEAMTLPEAEDKRVSLRHLEARKAQALERIMRQFVNHDPSEEDQPGSGTVTARPPNADLVGGMRSLIEEMLTDPELGDALRVDLAATLRVIVQDSARRPPLSDPDLGSDQQRLFGTDQYDEAPEQVPYSHRMRQVLLSLKSTHSDLASILQEVEELIHSLQLTQLNTAVVLYVTNAKARADNNEIIRRSVEVADSLGTIRRLARQIYKDLDLLRGEPYEFRRSVDNLREATDQLILSTESYRNRVQQIVEDRLASDPEELRNSFLLNIGEMLNLGPRLAHSQFQPSMQRAFGSTGDLLTRSYFGCRNSKEEQLGISSPV